MTRSRTSLPKPDGCDAGQQQNCSGNEIDNEVDPQRFTATARVPERGKGNDAGGEGEKGEHRDQRDCNPGATEGGIRRTRRNG